MNLKFYRIRENWHKHPWVSKFLCWMDRHDFEFREIENSQRVMLACFYCQKIRHSGFSGAKFDLKDFLDQQVNLDPKAQKILQDNRWDLYDKNLSSDESINF